VKKSRTGRQTNNRRKNKQQHEQKNTHTLSRETTEVTRRKQDKIYVFYYTNVWGELGGRSNNNNDNNNDTHTHVVAALLLYEDKTKTIK